MTRLRAATVILSAVGAGIAGYLTYVHLAGVQALCVGGSSGCARVQASEEAQLMGVPVALLGLVAYLVLVVANAARGDAARTVAVLVALVGFGFSAYLTYVAVVDIGATCQWCLASLAVMTALAVLTSARLLRE